MRRQRRTKRELQEASNHLHYEVSMLTRLASGLASGLARQSPLEYALLESFIIHVRVLLDFLYSVQPKADDIIGEDFFLSSEEWTAVRPPQSEILKLARRRANKELAHLTYARLDVTPEAKPWPFVEIANEIGLVIKVFLKHVPRGVLGSEWK